MSRTAWKIHKFNGGLNDYTDPKDLPSDEFAELTNVNIRQSGIIKPLGYPEVSSEVSSSEVFKNLIPGQGFSVFNSQYSPNAGGNISHLTIAAEQISYGANSSPSTMEFTLESMVW